MEPAPEPSTSGSATDTEAAYFRAEELARRVVEYYHSCDGQHRQRTRFLRNHRPYSWPVACEAVLQDELLDPTTAAFLVNELARQGCAEVAYACVELLRKRQPSPVDRSVLSAALTVAATHYDPKPALELYRALRDDENGPGVPELSSANLAIAACSHSGDLGHAMDVLQELLDAGVRPNSFTVMMLLQAANFKRRGAYAEAMRAIQSLELYDRASLAEELREGLMQVFEAAMRRSATFEEAVGLFRSLGSSGLGDEARSYNALLKTAARCGRWQEAHQYFVDMRQDDIQPTLETFTALIQACVEGRALEHALDVFEFMVAGRATHEATPADITTYNHLLHACHQAGMLEKALEIAAWMYYSGIEFDDKTYEEVSATIDIAMLWDEKVLGPKKGNADEEAAAKHRQHQYYYGDGGKAHPGATVAGPTPPHKLRPAPFDAMRMLYLSQLEQLQEEELLAMDKLGEPASWAPRVLTRGQVTPRGADLEEPSAAALAAAAAAMLDGLPPGASAADADAAYQLNEEPPTPIALSRMPSLRGLWNRDSFRGTAQHRAVSDYISALDSAQAEEEEAMRLAGLGAFGAAPAPSAAQLLMQQMGDQMSRGRAGSFLALGGAPPSLYRNPSMHSVAGGMASREASMVLPALNNGLGGGGGAGGGGLGAPRVSVGGAAAASRLGGGGGLRAYPSGGSGGGGLSAEPSQAYSAYGARSYGAGGGANSPRRSGAVPLSGERSGDGRGSPSPFGHRSAAASPAPNALAAAMAAGAVGVDATAFTSQPQRSAASSLMAKLKKQELAFMAGGN